MSVFGGDSWAREAQYRQRRLDDFIVEGFDNNGSSYKKLSTGKFACLLCPQNPVLDSPLMLSMHFKGSRHRSAELRLKEREFKRIDEIHKRIALSDSSANPGVSVTPQRKLGGGGASMPLVQRAKKAVFEVLDEQQKSEGLYCEINKQKSHVGHVTSNGSQNHSFRAPEGSEIVPVQQQSTFLERRERELKFIAAGWKRDCHGKWYRDENAEFDSDEEDPNETLG